MRVTVTFDDITADELAAVYGLVQTLADALHAHAAAVHAAVQQPRTATTEALDDPPF